MRGVLARFLWVVVLGALLSACAGLDSLFATAAAESSGEWRITEKTDAITGSPASTALLCSSKTMNSALAVTPAATSSLVASRESHRLGSSMRSTSATPKIPNLAIASMRNRGARSICDFCRTTGLS